MCALDKFDTKILELLQAQGRLTNNELSALVGLSASQCSRRRSHLEKTGIISGYHAQLDKQSAGVAITCFVSINLSSHNAGNATEFAALIESLPAVLEAHSLTGEMDYLLKVVSHDLKSLAEFINSVLLSHQSINTVKTSVVLDTVKETMSLPVR